MSDQRDLNPKVWDEIQKTWVAYDAVTGKPTTRQPRPPWTPKAPVRNKVSAIHAYTNEDGHLTARIMEWQDEHGYWHIGCTCDRYQRVRPGHLPECWHFNESLMLERDTTDDNGVKRGLQSRVAIPVFHKPALLCYVSVEDSMTTLPLASLIWHPQFGHGLLGDAPLGVVTPTTGRWGIRGLIIEFAVTLWVTRRDVLKCESRFHSWGYYERPEYQDAETGMPTPEACADMLSLLMTTQCIRCREDTGIPDV